MNNKARSIPHNKAKKSKVSYSSKDKTSTILHHHISILVGTVWCNGRDFSFGDGSGPVYTAVPTYTTAVVVDLGTIMADSFISEQRSNARVVYNSLW